MANAINDIVEQTNILLTVGTNEMEILEFTIDAKNLDTGEVEAIYFGMNVAKVMQVIESPNLDPGQHDQNPAFLGTIPLRDMILPVIDLPVWLGIERGKKEDEVVIVTEFSNAVTGFLVSNVTEIHRVGWDSVKPPGTYLGRVLVAAIVGTIDIDGRIIQLLDIESVLADLDPDTMQAAQKSHIKSKIRYPILLADDSPTIRTMLERNLVDANLNPTITTNGKEAHDVLMALKERSLKEGVDIRKLVSIVVADIEMPMMDGFTLTKIIKEDPVLGKLPVILYSSIITDELRHKGESVGADEQISKPDIHKMAERVLDLIESSQ